MGENAAQGRAELVLIRHAPTDAPGRLCGRTDVSACIDPEAVARLAARLPQGAPLICSPARRCRQTAAALFPDASPDIDDTLWEQDFGAHDGMAYADLPDIGVLSRARIAAHRPPGGESFRDVATRVAPALDAHAARACVTRGPVVLVVHAGVIRAALGYTLGLVEAGLAFEIAHLSVTRLGVGPDGPVSVIAAGAVA